jgi:hypothetical protein
VVVHILLAAALSLVVVKQGVQRAMMDLVMAPAPADDIEFPEPQEAAEFDAEATPGEHTADAAGAVIDPGRPTLGAEIGAGSLAELTAEVAYAAGAGGGERDGPFGGLGGAGGVFGDGTGGSAEFGDGLGAAPTAKFFGAKIEGRSIVFVLDNSGSMQGGRLETVIAELKRCVDALTEKQVFYVVFYSDVAYPLFYPEPEPDFIRPTDRNKQLLSRWLDTVELCLGDAVGEALAGAITLEPDAVFLLSDGRIQGERKMQFLLSAGGGRFPIHTVGVGVGGETARLNLQQIAEANDGDFREAEIPEDMRELARQNPRPYHNDGPGPIWGLNVKPRRAR